MEDRLRAGSGNTNLGHVEVIPTLSFLWTLPFPQPLCYTLPPPESEKVLFKKVNLLE
jgi:hypothetical protein